MQNVTILKTFQEGGMTYLKGSVIRLTPEAVAEWSKLGRCEAPAPATPPVAPAPGDV
ncbi:MAG: hypothetical protein K0R17_1017 [Rariglobus sp.]|jgi:hypothetical protein|nr:hypothetical protein [Rariglobus sp.]